MKSSGSPAVGDGGLRADTLDDLARKKDVEQGRRECLRSSPRTGAPKPENNISSPRSEQTGAGLALERVSCFEAERRDRRRRSGWNSSSS